jgi:hypothetical protein
MGFGPTSIRMRFSAAARYVQAATNAGVMSGRAAASTVSVRSWSARAGGESGRPPPVGAAGTPHEHADCGDDGDADSIVEDAEFEKVGLFAAGGEEQRDHGRDEHHRRAVVDRHQEQAGQEQHEREDEGQRAVVVEELEEPDRQEEPEHGAADPHQRAPSAERGRRVEHCDDSEHGPICPGEVEQRGDQTGDAGGCGEPQRPAEGRVIGREGTTNAGYRAGKFGDQAPWDLV